MHCTKDALAVVIKLGMKEKLTGSKEKNVLNKEDWLNLGFFVTKN